MKFIIRMPNGVKKTRECNDQSEIKIMLARGWKEVAEKPAPKISKPKPKKKSKKK